MPTKEQYEKIKVAQFRIREFMNKPLPKKTAEDIRNQVKKSSEEFSKHLREQRE